MRKSQAVLWIFALCDQFGWRLADDGIFANEGLGNKS